MASYTVTIVNQSGVNNRKFAWFSAPPVLNGNPQDPKAFTNIWCSSAVSQGGYKSVSWTSDTYAYVGQSPAQVAPGVTISGGCSAVATLATNGQRGSSYPMQIADDNPSISNDTATEDCTSNGAFQIVCGNDFTPGDNMVLGVGKVNPTNGLVVPVSTIRALPGSVNVIQPVVKIYVNNLSTQLGQIVNFQTTSKDSGCADFSSAAANGCTAATITQSINGKWTTSYYKNPSSMRVNVASTMAMASPSVVSVKTADLQKLMALVKGLSLAPPIPRSPSAPGVGAAEAAEPELLADVIEYLGQINWAAATTAIAMSAAITFISTYFMSKNYTLKYNTKTGPEGSSTDFNISPPAGAASFMGVLGSSNVPGFVKDDWTYAISNDGQTQFQDKTEITCA